MAPQCSHTTTICHFPFWFQWKHLSRLPKLWNFHLVDSKCFQIKFITNKFIFTGRCHFQLSNIRITKRFWLAVDDDYLRGATSINHQVALHANFKMYSRSTKGGEKGDPNHNPWLAKMIHTGTWLSKLFEYFIFKFCRESSMCRIEDNLLYAVYKNVVLTIISVLFECLRNNSWQP
jgi:hypothetical protein